MTRRELLSPKWVFGHLLALALVVAFVNFGFWQLRRLEQARERNAVVTARSAMEPLSPGAALARGDDLDFLPVVATGTYDPQDEVLLRGRSLDGQPGYHVLTPLVLDATAGALAGRALLVERGWVPYDMDRVPVEAALPPAGSVTVRGELHAPQTPPTGALAGLAARDPAEGELTQTFYVDVERLQPQIAHELLPAYLTLRSQTPPTAGALPRPLPEPVFDEGPHLGYAIQWFAFAVVGVVGYFFLLRSVLRQPAAGAAARREAPGEGEPRTE